MNQPVKPVLTAKHEELAETHAAIGKASDTYARLKVTVNQLQSDPGSVDVSTMGLKLCVGEGVELPLPLPDDVPQLIVYLENAGGQLGSEIVRLWGVAHQITTAAVTHCTAAQQSATPPQAPAPQAPAPQVQV